MPTVTVSKAAPDSPVKPPDKPQIVELLLPVSEIEFLGRQGLSDQVIWRRRESDESKVGKVFAQIIHPNGIRELQHLSFSDFDKFACSQSWDGNIYLALNKIDWEAELLGKITFDEQKSIEEYLRSLEPKSKDENEKIEKQQQVRAGRAAVCSCFAGKWVSITVRGKAPKSDKHSSVNAHKNTHQKMMESPWIEKNPKRTPEYPFAFEDYVRTIAHCLFESNELLSDDYELSAPLSGLIVIMGETGSGKSEIAYGLMHEYLKRRTKADNTSTGRQKNFYHVVTLEDPIEKLFHTPSVKYPESAQGEKCNLEFIDYTARHKTIDTTLKDGLRDCLRQKPTIVCVGEVRELSDWHEVLNFAGTGHLVVATAHAGSLTEALGKLLFAYKAKTPVRRGDAARKILGLVQLTPTELGIQVNLPDKEVAKPHVIMMSIWRRTHGGASKLVSEGLSSLVPHYKPSFGSIGAQAMCDLLIGKGMSDQAIPADRQADFMKEMRKEARAHDLKGL